MKQDYRYGYLIIPISMALLAVGLVFVINLSGVGTHGAAPGVQPTAYQSPTPRPTEVPVTAVAAVEVAAGFDPTVVRAGGTTFQGTCAACHGANARGIPGLGKDLVMGDFINTHTDAEVLTQVINGRQPTDPLNTTGVLMPPRGGNPSLTDEKLTQVITYLRALHAQAEGQALAMGPATPAPTYNPNFVLPIQSLGQSAPTAETTETVGESATAEATAVVVAVAPTPEQAVVEPGAFDAALAYNLSCSGCHGLHGEGTPNNGPALVGDMLVMNSPSFVFNYLTANRAPQDPRDGFPHPLWGEYPALDADQLNALIDYVRTLK